MRYRSLEHEFEDPTSHESSPSSSRNSLSDPRTNAIEFSGSFPNTSGTSTDEGINGRHSLAHELAAALMPEPTPGSRLLADEFGIEFDEGAEGIDEDTHQHIQSGVNDMNDSTLPAGEMDIQTSRSRSSSSQALIPNHRPSISASSRIKLEHDPMVILSEDLQSTDKFLSHLRRLDLDTSPSHVPHMPPALERFVSDIVRRTNDIARDREGQVRELLECDRELRKIGSEVGGSDVLGQLDEIPSQFCENSSFPSGPETRHLESVQEEPSVAARYSDWETDLDYHHISDNHRSFHPALPSAAYKAPPATTTLVGPSSPATAIPHLTDLRSFTTSLVSSLSTLSEQAQVNGAAITEAGRKIRALKNKIGGWRTDWDGAERSRMRVESWEAGILEGHALNSVLQNTADTTNVRRVDGRTLVAEHLQAFAQVIAEASVKTQVIMAAS